MKVISFILVSISAVSLLFLIISFILMTELPDNYRIIGGLIFMTSTGLMGKLNTWKLKKWDVIELKPAFFLFFSGIICTILASHVQSTDLFKYIVLFVAVLYLLSGWSLFCDYYPEAGNSLLFFISYAYSSIFCGFTLSLFSWPFYKLLLFAGLGWSAILIIIYIINWKKIPEKGLIQLFAEVFLMIIMTFYQLFLVTHFPT